MTETPDTRPDGPAEGRPEGDAEGRKLDEAGEQGPIIRDKRRIDPLTGAGRDAVFIHPEDAAELHLARGDRVRLRSGCGTLDGTVFPVVIARGNLQVHWPEGNPLLARGRTDPAGGVPEYNAVVTLEPLPADAS